MFRKISDSSKSYLIKNNITIESVRSIRSGCTTYRFFKSDDKINVHKMFEFSPTDEQIIRGIVPSGDEIINRMIKNNVITESFINDNTYWMNEVKKHVMSTLIKAFHGRLCDTIEATRNNGESYMLTKFKIVLNPFEIEPSKIADSITAYLSDKLSSQPLIYSYPKDIIPIIEIDTKTNEVISTIYASSRLSEN